MHKRSSGYNDKSISLSAVCLKKWNDNIIYIAGNQQAVKNWSGHIIFPANFQWSELAKPFPDLWELVSKETHQAAEEVQYDQVSLYLNLEELKRNNKPIGYLKEGAKYRLVFPVDKKEMIIYRGILSDSIRDVTEQAAKILRDAKIKFTVEYDKMLLQEVRARRK